MNFMNFNFEIDKLWGTYFIPAIFFKYEISETAAGGVLLKKMFLKRSPIFRKTYTEEHLRTTASTV